MSKDYHAIGQIGRPHGLNGLMKVSLEATYATIPETEEAVFLEQGGRMIPYFIRHFTTGNHYLLGLEEVDSREAAAALTHQEIFVPATAIEALELDEEEADWVGYTLIDQTLGTLGEVIEQLKLPQHELLRLAYQGRDVLVPLHHELIVRIDADQQQLVMDLPEGLLALG